MHRVRCKSVLLGEVVLH